MTRGLLALFGVLLCLTGCSEGTAIPQKRVTEDIHLKTLVIKPGQILVLDLLADPGQKWDTDNTHYTVLSHGDSSRNVSMNRSYIAKPAVVIYMRVHSSFVIDWRYTTNGGRTWLYAEIKLDSKEEE